MAIFASLRYSGKECVRTQDESIVLQIGFNGFKSKSGSMATKELFFIHNLNMTSCASNPQQSNIGATNELELPNPKSFGS